MAEEINTKKSFFEYVGLDRNKKRVSGSLDAFTKEDVVRFMNEKELIVLSIDEVSPIFSLKKLSEINVGGVPLEEKVLFMKQFSIMVNAGLSITRTLEILSIQAQNPRFKMVLKESLKLVSGGLSLSDTFAKYPDTFDEITISLIRAGEQSGNLDKIFRKLSAEYQGKAELSSKIRSALAYPAVITLLMVGVIIFLMLFVVPQLKQAFEDFNATLPLITQIVVGFSTFLVNYWYIVLLLTISAAVAGRYYIGTPGGLRVFQRLLISIPIFGPLNIKVQTANFARILYLLISSGVPILQALELTEQAMTNIWFKDEVSHIREQVKRGVPVSVPLLQSEYFPLILGYMVNVGQETGKVDVVLRKIARYYSVDIKASTVALTSILEPILLIAMGIIVGGIVVSIYLPMFQLTQFVQ